MSDKGALRIYVSVFNNNTGKWEIRKKRVHSFVVGFMGMLGAALEETTQTTATYKDYTGTLRDMKPSQTGLNLTLNGADLGNANVGIALGTGTTTPAPSDNAMTTLIAHGNAAGQLSYGSMAVVEGAVNGSAVQVSCSRPFTNNSGGAINVKEVGLFLECGDHLGNNNSFLAIHDLLTLTYNNGDTKTITITISATT